MLHRRRRTAVLAVAGLLAMAFAPASASTDHIDVVVVLDADHPGARGAARAVAAQHDVEATHVYGHALDGFSGPVSPGRLRALERDPRVALVEPDAEVTQASQEIPTGVQRVEADENAAIGIDGDGGAVDADVAVLDTAIDASHPDLDVISSVSCLGEVRGGHPDTRGVCAPAGPDGAGHGTHVAGTIAALDNDLGVVGVAPGARLWSVKTMDDAGNGTISSVVAGIDYVTAHADQIEVANLSLVADASRAMDEAISASVAAGVVYVLAAGNDGVDVSEVSPAGHPDALTVAAIADFDGEPGGHADAVCDGTEVPFKDDAFATALSNYGDGVDLLASGTCITSTAPGGGTSIEFGTSMAAPHVAGGAAILASQGMDVATIHNTLVGHGSDDWETDTYLWGQAPPLLDVGDETVFAPTLVGGEPVDPGDPFEPYSLTAESVRDGGSWRAVASVDAGREREGVQSQLSYVSANGATDVLVCELDDGACEASVPLPNRDRSVTFTLTVDGEDVASATVRR